MRDQPARNNGALQVQVLAHAPPELTTEKLLRLGEGIGKVVYASKHWVVKRERHRSEIMALIAVWKAVRKVERWLPGKMGRRLLERPSKQIHFLRLLVQPLMVVIPKSFWLMTHVGEVWHLYHTRDTHGERLADAHLAGTEVVPAEITFPPIKVRVGGWPGSLTVSEATERVEATLDQRLRELAMAGRWEDLEDWLGRFLALRQLGWQRGVFSLDAHLKNYGVTEDRVVLIDAGGLTNSWEEIEKRLSFEAKVVEPHKQLGLGPLLRERPDIAERFDAQWKATVNAERIRHHWPVGAQSA